MGRLDLLYQQLRRLVLCPLSYRGSLFIGPCLVLANYILSLLVCHFGSIALLFVVSADPARGSGGITEDVSENSKEFLSPAINKAMVLSEVTEDFFHRRRGSIPDIGAYESGQSSPVGEGKVGDMNMDGHIDMVDIGIVIHQYGLNLQCTP